MKGLVFDFGGPVLLTPFEVRGVGERNLGLPAGSFAWTGPFDPDSDADWRTFQSGEMNERQYWALQAKRFAELTGRSADMTSMMAPLYAGEESELIRPGAADLIRDAKAAGVKVGIHTNDLTTFHDVDWLDRMTILREFEVMVDGRTDGVYKPDTDAYRLMVERMGMSAEDIVFIDDQPVNIAGAESIGMVCVHLDPTDPEPAFVEARKLLELPAA
jgi:putative hydrolase of the HAD superfamily